MGARILIGDCRERLKELPDDSVDSVVCDPPYELGFMGKAWDNTGIANDAAMWRTVLRVLKPGGHMVAFSGTRTYHRMVCAIEDAGFEIRDQLAWVYGSGFPKSLDVSKAIDKAAGAVREVVGSKLGRAGYSLNQCDNPGGVAMEGNVDGSLRNPAAECAITAPATEAAQQWSGWGTALKPSWEPICLARKPLIGTVANNVLTHGTGALNIDGCRIEHGETLTGGTGTNGKHEGWDRPWMHDGERRENYQSTLGRWPANLCHDGSDEVLAGFPTVHGAGAARDASEGTHSGPSGMFGLGEAAMPTSPLKPIYSMWPPLPSITPP